MRYTVLILPGQEPGIYAAFVPALDVVTQDDSIEGAIQSAHDAASLAIRGKIKDDEEVPVERPGAIVASVEVDVPVAAEAVAKSASGKRTVEQTR